MDAKSVKAALAKRKEKANLHYLLDDGDVDSINAGKFDDVDPDGERFWPGDDAAGDRNPRLPELEQDAMVSPAHKKLLEYEYSNGVDPRKSPLFKSIPPDALRKAQDIRDGNINDYRKEQFKTKDSLEPYSKDSLYPGPDTEELARVMELNKDSKTGKSMLQKHLEGKREPQGMRDLDPEQMDALKSMSKQDQAAVLKVLKRYDSELGKNAYKSDYASPSEWYAEQEGVESLDPNKDPFGRWNDKYMESYRAKNKANKKAKKNGK